MIGLSLSPGGLLLPYHLGALSSLMHYGILTNETPMAGSSAGSIAVAAVAAGVPTTQVLEASIRVSQHCNPLFLARGGLLEILKHELDTQLPKDAHEIVNQRSGSIGLAHYEVYPTLQPRLQKQPFESREALIHAVCDSSTFPYFTTNTPVGIHWKDKNHKSATTAATTTSSSRSNRNNRNRLFDIDRLVLDGIFTEPPPRFGCPDLSKIAPPNTREVQIMVCPKELPSLLDLDVDIGRMHNKRWDRNHNTVCPDLQVTNIMGQATFLGLSAVTVVPRKWLTGLYDSGYRDAEKWVFDEQKRQRHQQKQQNRNQKR